MRLAFVAASGPFEGPEMFKTGNWPAACSLFLRDPFILTSYQSLNLMSLHPLSIPTHTLWVSNSPLKNIPF